MQDAICPLCERTLSFPSGDNSDAPASSLWDVGSVYFGPNHPMKPHRLCTTHHLVLSYELHKKMEIYRPHKAYPVELAQFHSADYVEFLHRITPDTQPLFSTELAKLFAVIWAVYCCASFAWIGQDILVMSKALAEKGYGVFLLQWSNMERYGEIKDVFLDGAKGEGKKDMEYFFHTWFSLIHQLQPLAVIFSDAGLDTRWVGNELGLGASTCWSIYNSTLTPIHGIYNDPRYAAEGDSAGHEWVPALCDVSIRPDMVKNKGFLPSGRSEIHKQRNQIKAIINSLLPACNSADPDTHVAFNADAIIANPPAYGHTHVAELLKVPLHIFFTMPWTPTYEFPHPLSRVKQQMAYRLGIRDLINEFRKKKLKLRPITYLSGSYTSPPNMPYGYIWSPHLVPKPKDWGPNIDVVGFCFLDLASDYEPPISLLEWLEEGEKEGKKPIYIGFGSLPLEQPDKMTQIIIEALDKTGQRGIINKGWGGLGNLAETKKSVYLLDNCPHDWLFPRCKAVVHHGGAGTTAAGLRAACPTTIVPFFGDQPFWGERVHARGVGPAPIPVDEFTLGRLVDAINYMLKPEVKRNAEELADAMKHEDGVAGAVAAFYKHYHPQTLDSETNHQPVATVPRLGFSFLGCFGLSRSKSTTSR